MDKERGHGRGKELEAAITNDGFEVINNERSTQGPSGWCRVGPAASQLLLFRVRGGFACINAARVGR